MTQITPEQDIALNEDRLRSLMETVSDLRHMIEELKKEAETGGKINDVETNRRLLKLGSIVTTCSKVEITLDECRNRQAGIARGGYALDMDKARADIGCKLDQLRRCDDPGTIFE